MHKTNLNELKDTVTILSTCGRIKNSRKKIDYKMEIQRFNTQEASPKHFKSASCVFEVF